MSSDITEKKVVEMLDAIKDPEIGISIVKLGMVKNVEISNKSVKVTILLTIPTCPLADSIKTDVKNVLLSSKMFDKVDVDLKSMSDKEREEMIAKLHVNKPKYVNDYEKKKEMVLTPPSLSDLKKEYIKYIIPVGSGKGGVGKSLVTSLLAIELSKKGYKVGIMDADITGSSISKIFNVNGPLQVDGNTIIPPKTKKYGIKIISTAMFLEKEEQPVIWRGPIVSQMITQFFNDVDWDVLDFLLLDMPPGTSDIPLTVFQRIPVYGMIFVKTPQELASMIVKKAINMADAMKVKQLGMIENMSYVKCPHCGKVIELWGESGETGGLPLLGRIPVQMGLSESVDRGDIENWKDMPYMTEIVDKLLKIIKA